MRIAVTFCLLLSSCAAEVDDADLEPIEGGGACDAYGVRFALLNLRRTPGTDQKQPDDIVCELGPADLVRRVRLGDGSFATAFAPSDLYLQGEWWLVDANPGDASGRCSGRGWVAGLLPDALSAACVALPACGPDQVVIGAVRADQVDLRASAAGASIARLPANSRLLVRHSAGPWLRVEQLEPGPAVEVPPLEDVPVTLAPRAAAVRTGYVAASAVQLACSSRSGLVRPSWATYLWAEHTDRSSSSAARASNMALAAARLDGLVVEPGGELSYLGAIVQPYRHHFPAGVYTGGLPCPIDLHAEGGRCRMFGDGASTSGGWVEGGGVCGMSTALHRAAMRSGIGIARWYAHSYRFAGFELIYGHQGEDAQVAWSGGYATAQDYALVNDSGGRLFLATSIRTEPDGETAATVQIWGEAPRDRIVRLARPCLGGCASTSVPSLDGSSLFLADDRELVERVTWRTDGAVPGVSPVVDPAYPGSIWTRAVKVIDGRSAELLRFSPYYAPLH